MRVAHGGILEDKAEGRLWNMYSESWMDVMMRAARYGVYVIVGRVKRNHHGVRRKGNNIMREDEAAVRSEPVRRSTEAA